VIFKIHSNQNHNSNKTNSQVFNKLNSGSLFYQWCNKGQQNNLSVIHWTQLLASSCYSEWCTSILHVNDICQLLSTVMSIYSVSPACFNTWQLVTMLYCCLQGVHSLTWLCCDSPCFVSCFFLGKSIAHQFEQPQEVIPVFFVHKHN